jgi:hypothetical protein
MSKRFLMFVVTAAALSACKPPAPPTMDMPDPAAALPDVNAEVPSAEIPSAELPQPAVPSVQAPSVTPPTVN